ncbi:protein NDNF-like [Lemur catta]|uniref:protein NDNF-like n=1 Tax=Lemur catta TaxID=9447 RepID=UPI001E269521|nr:protein NDNF-like [Lemur catta]XP_045410658.1 protein NDNF-like [Lemur catta]
MALLRCCLLWLLLPVGCGTQKLPTRDEELFQMQIRDKAFFHDSSVIPDGAEISSYLFRDTLKRYFFVVEEDNTPLSVTVTPCDVPLEWKLSLQELPEETSGEGSVASPKRGVGCILAKVPAPWCWTKCAARGTSSPSSSVRGAPGDSTTVPTERTREYPAPPSQMGPSDSQGAKAATRAAWRCITRDSGALSLTTAGRC